MENLSFINGKPIVISRTQIDANSRRTRKKGYITNIDINEINKLYLKHYGKYDETGNLIGTYDPYTGKLIVDADTLALDHIIPVNSHGGTILFNCIPTDTYINKSKNGTHLIEWWKKQSFYKEENLEKLLDYIFEAYDETLDTFSLKKAIDEEIKKVKREEKEERKVLDNAPLERTQKELQDEYKDEKAYDYALFLQDLINEASEGHKSIYNEKLQKLKSNAKFNEFEDYEYLQNILTNIIKQNNISTNGVDDRHELTIMSKYNLVKLFDKLKDNPKEEWKNIINKRLLKIEGLLHNSNCTLSTFYENIDKEIGKFILEDEINEQEFYGVLEKTELSIHDRIIAIINHVENNSLNKLPSESAEETKKLGELTQRIKKIGSGKSLATRISKGDLIRLGTSEYEALQNLYKGIIEAYTKLKEKNRDSIIRDYEEAIKEVEENPVEIKYYEKIEDNPAIPLIINHVENNPKRKLPSQAKETKKLGELTQSIKRIDRGKYLATRISKGDLIRLGTSEYEALQNLYKGIIEAYTKLKESNKYYIRDYEEAIKEVEENPVEIKYYEKIEDNPAIPLIIKFVSDDENNSKRKLPSAKADDEGIKKLGILTQNIKRIKDGKSLATRISKGDLILLGTSEYEALQNLYKDIIEKYTKLKESNGYYIRDYEEAMEYMNNLEVNEVNKGMSR